MNIFNIGKANERISALESELATAKQELQTEKDNSTQLETAAADLKAKLDTETQAHAATKQAKDSEISTLKAAQADFDSKVEKAASAKAQQITASIGVSAIPNTPSATPGAPAKVELSGIEKTRAAFRAQFEKNQPK